MAIENEQEFREWCRYTLNNNAIDNYVVGLNTVSNNTGEPISPTTLATVQHVDDATALLRRNNLNPKTIENMQAAMRKYVEMVKSIANIVATHGHMLQKKSYSALNSRPKEAFNFQKVAAVLADYGFNCIKLADDWQGADFLAYHFSGDKTLKVQLKARITINKKYIGKGLFIAFPHGYDWFLVEHDKLVQLIEATTNWLNTASWCNRGIYHSANPSLQLLQALSQFNYLTLHLKSCQKLNPRQKEIFNFQKVAAVLADYGFNCMKLADDWQGADFLAYHFSGDRTLKIQLKARITINKNYLEKDLFITFPNDDSWYLVEHDKLVELIEETTNWLNTASWVNSGIYHSSRPNSELLRALSGFKL